MVSLRYLPISILDFAVKFAEVQQKCTKLLKKMTKKVKPGTYYSFLFIGYFLQVSMVCLY